MVLKDLIWFVVFLSIIFIGDIFIGGFGRVLYVFDMGMVVFKVFMFFRGI